MASASRVWRFPNRNENPDAGYRKLIAPNRVVNNVLNNLAAETPDVIALDNCSLQRTLVALSRTYTSGR